MAFLRKYAVTVGAQFVGSVAARVPLGDADMASARDLGAALVAAIAEEKTWPDQAQAFEEQRRRFGQIIALRKDDWPYEHTYWRERGWL